jgi:hypothetical protein
MCSLPQRQRSSGKRRMTSDYATMLRSVAQVQGAAAAAWMELALRSGRFLVSGAETLIRSMAQPFRAGQDRPQNAIEDAVWTAYSAHEEMLRAMTGLPRLAILVFLNELDLRRQASVPPQSGE